MPGTTRGVMRILWMSLAALVFAVPALGQTGRSDMPRGFVGGLAGTTMGDAPTAGVFAAQGGVRLKGGLFAIGEFGGMQDLLPPAFQTQLEVIARIVGLEGGGDLTLDGRLTALYGLGGIGWMRSMGRWAPFVEGGAGMTRLRLHVDASGGNAMLANDGINIRPASRWRVDAGYRYYRIFTDDPVINVNSVYGAIKFQF